MGMSCFVENLNFVQANVQESMWSSHEKQVVWAEPLVREEDILVNGLEHARDRQVVLQLDRHLLVCQCFEDREDQLLARW